MSPGGCLPRKACLFRGGSCLRGCLPGGICLPGGGVSAWGRGVNSRHP